MTAPRVLSVGQCGFDHGRLTRYLRESFGAETEGADTRDDALERLRSAPFGLVLVNRLLDLDGSNGLDLIRAIKADPALADVPAMLVSNYPEAQAEAASLGALRGFGKADLGKPRARDAISAAFTSAEADRLEG
jgi:CheY-like chemotaxis protein